MDVTWKSNIANANRPLSTRRLIRLFTLLMILLVLSSDSGCLLFAQDKTDPSKRTYQEVYSEAVKLWADSKGDWNAARNMSSAASKMAIAQFGRDSKENAAAEHLLAEISLFQGRPAEAEKIIRHAFEVRLAQIGKNSPQAFESAICLAYCLNNQQKFRESDKLCRRWLETCNRLGDQYDRLRMKYLVQFGHCAVRLKNVGTGENIFKVLIPLQDRLTPDDLIGRAISHQRLADCLNLRTRFKEAEPFCRKSLALHRANHKKQNTRLSRLQMAGALWNLASNLNAQYPRNDDRIRESVRHIRESLAIREAESLPGHHQHILNARHLLSYALYHLRQFDEAESLARQVWETRKQHEGASGQKTLKALRQYISFIQDRKPFSETEPLLRHSILHHRNAFGPMHELTRGAMTSLARKLDHEHRFVESLEIQQIMLTDVRRIYGEIHAKTASAYNALGMSLSNQGKHAEAARMIRQAISINQRVGRGDSLSQGIYLHNLSSAVAELEGLSAAIKISRQALEIHERRSREPYANPALIKNSLASFLARQGKYDEAQSIYLELEAEWKKTGGPLRLARRALAVNAFRKHDFPDAENLLRELLESISSGSDESGDNIEEALSYRRQLAIARYFQGDVDESINLLEEAETKYRVLRQNWALTGLDRALTSRTNPAELLAVLYAEKNRPVDAWKKWETSRALGLLDEIAYRAEQQISPVERKRREKLLTDIRDLEAQLRKRNSAPGNNLELKNRLDELNRERLAIEKLLFATLPLHREHTSLEELQKHLPPDGAIIGWVDPFPTHATGLSNNHWGVVVRKKGLPHWVKLPGDHETGAWTEQNRDLRKTLVARLARRNNAASLKQLNRDLQKFHDLRLSPLQKFLGKKNGLPSVKHLIVVPSVAIQGVSIQNLASNYSISYTPSATVYTLLAKRHMNRLGTDRWNLLAVADPTFPPKSPTSKNAIVQNRKLPEKGLIVTGTTLRIQKETGLRAGDVLLEFDGKGLNHRDELVLAMQEASGERMVTIRYLRDLQEKSAAFLGKFEVTVSPLSMSEAKTIEAKTSSVLRSAGESDEYSALPGTRREVAALNKEFQARRGHVDLLLGKQATESAIRELSQSNRLSDYRFIHLATHGLVDSNEPMRSALLLSAESDSTRAINDSRLTAGEMLSEWNLNAELVTLSACQTALGRFVKGEGHIGFAQSLLLAGSDSVLLSLWKVDDAATALLMQRFYQNVLGTRSGLTAPMPKHAALREAQTWLRSLSRKEIVQWFSKIPQLERGDPVETTALPIKLTNESDEFPYSDPYFWSGFILVGYGQ